MKKKNLIVFALIVILSLCIILFTACDFGKKEVGVTTYTIMYSDGEKVHSLQVKHGEVYSIDTPLPNKEGMLFTGLFDSEIGGTQYVSKDGVSLAPFTDKRNVTLFPQFKALKYILKFDYGEAQVTGDTQIEVDYDGEMPNLPTNLQISDKYYMNFIGWYAPGYWNDLKVSNADGIPLVGLDKLISGNYFSDYQTTLVAKFELLKYDIIFLDNDGQIIKKVKAEHGKRFSDISKNIYAGGKEVISWSLNKNGEVFDGVVERELTVYPKEFLEVVTKKFVLENCQKENGYNPSTKGDDYALGMQKGYDIVELVISNAVYNSNSDSYSIASKNVELKLYLRLLQDIAYLPISSNDNAIMKNISEDDFSGKVFETNISNKKIGQGAYYISISYTDGTRKEINATDILKGRNKGDKIPMNISLDSQKIIESIKIIVLYEIYSGAPGFLGIWWHAYSNWRCITTLKFN